MVWSSLSRVHGLVTYLGGGSSSIAGEGHGLVHLPCIQWDLNPSNLRSTGTHAVLAEAEAL